MADKNIEHRLPAILAADMPRMLVDGRFDCMLVGQEEAEELSRQAGDLGGQIIAI